MRKILKPSFFIIGAPKCGTTSLFNYLEQHKDVLGSKVKEPHHFCKDFQKESKKFHKKNIFKYKLYNNYEKLFLDEENHLISGEASVFYLFSKSAPKEIFKYNKNAKIIIMIRNPIDFLESLHAKYLVTAQENELNIEKAYYKEKLRKKDWNYVYKGTAFPFKLQYSELMYFSIYIKNYLDIFPKKQVHLILFDDLKDNSEKVFNDTLDFLELKNNSKINFKQYNKRREIRFFFLKNLLKFTDTRIKNIIKFLIPNSFYNFCYNKIKILITREAIKKNLDIKFEKELKTKYYNEVLRLSKYFKQDLIKLWKFDKK